MPDNRNPDIAALFQRDPVTVAVAVADGYGLSLRVNRGHLVIEDGIGRHRRTRRYSRAERTLRRILILGQAGYLSLEAVRWCADIGIAILHVDSTGRVLTVHGGPGTDDPRLRRAQAAAASSAVGIDITHRLLGAKLNGQATVLHEVLGAHAGADMIRDLTDQLQRTNDLIGCRDLEAKASNIYFGTWAAKVSCRFTERDAPRVPEHWSAFTARTSRLHQGGRSPRNAADPINALLNYGYALAETECRIAGLAVGLDPGIGVVHTDKKNRDSLALDLIERLRPLVETHILSLLTTRHFRAGDFHETRDGACRVLAPLSHELAQWMPNYAREVAHHAEAVAHMLAKTSPGKIDLRTPLTRANTIASQPGDQRNTARRAAKPVMPNPTCRTCGTTLTDRTRQLCATCWPVTRAKLALDRAGAANQVLATMRANGDDPSTSPDATARRSAALAQRKREELAWKDSAVTLEWTAEFYLSLITLVTTRVERLEELGGFGWDGGRGGGRGAPAGDDR